MGKKSNIVRQAERLQRGEINRRRFIMSALATGVTLPTATSLATKAEAAHPKPGGALRLGVGDPQRLADMRALATGSTLLEVGTDGRLTGDLAETFEPSREAQQWTFTLRRGVSFSDGTALDAETVVAALSKADTPGLRGQIKALRADGAHRVVLDLVHPNADFAWVLSDPALTIRNAAGLGTGAYVEMPNATRLHKASMHWKAGRGHFESVDLIPLPEPAARMTALLNGEIDLMDDVDPKMFALLERTPDIALIETEEASLYGLTRQDHTPSGVGRALNDVTDRRDLARQVLLGHGRAQACARCSARPKITEMLRFEKATWGFPGEDEMLKAIARMASERGLPVTASGAQAGHFRAERLRLRPTVDWTLSEAVARMQDAKLEEFVVHARRSQSMDEKTSFQNKALHRIDYLGDVIALVANDIHAHRARLTLPAGAFDALRVAERGWFAW